MLRIILLTEKTAEQTIQIFSQNYSSYIGTFHIFMFPINCVKRGTVELITIH